MGCWCFKLKILKTCCIGSWYSNLYYSVLAEFIGDVKAILFQLFFCKLSLHIKQHIEDLQYIRFRSTNRNDYIILYSQYNRQLIIRFKILNFAY